MVPRELIVTNQTTANVINAGGDESPGCSPMPTIRGKEPASISQVQAARRPVIASDATAAEPQLKSKSRKSPFSLQVCLLLVIITFT